LNHQNNSVNTIRSFCGISTIDAPIFYFFIKVFFDIVMGGFDDFCFGFDFGFSVNSGGTPVGMQAFPIIE